MGVNLKIDANRALENKGTRHITTIVIITVLVLIMIVLGMVLFFGSKGKNVKTPFMEVSTPAANPGQKTDTAVIITDNSVDQSKHLDIKDNHGKQSIKF